MSDRYFLISFSSKEDRKLLKQKFKNYQALINAVYYDEPNLEIKTKNDIVYVLNF